MFKTTKRAERRHHYARIKNRAQRNGYWGKFHRSDWTKGQLGAVANTPCVCSTCYGCANQRKVSGLKTLAEYRAADSFQDQIDDLE